MDNFEFAKTIETMCIDKGMDYIDAIVTWCKDNDVEIETIANYIKKDQVLKSKIQIEAENLNILKKGARLPV